MRRLLSLAVVVLLAACQSHYAQIAELRRPTEGARILLMPPDIELYEIGAFGTAEPRAEWTEAAKAHLVEALRKQNAARGLRLVDYDPARVSADDRAEIEQLENLHGVVGRTILDHHYVPVRSLPSLGGQQLGFASLVDLDTGDIVWFNRILRDFGDLRDAAAANTTARELLAGLPK
jgi:hypothetical protein